MKPASILQRTFARAVFPLALVTLVSAVCLPSFERTAHAENTTAARDHWERGTRFYDLRKYDEAIKEFEAAYQAKGDPAFLYNLAQSHRLAGHANEALGFYRTYLRYVPKAANRADIELRIKELEKAVADRPAGDSAATTPPPPPPTVTAPGSGTTAPGATNPPPPTTPAPSVGWQPAPNSSPVPPAAATTPDVPGALGTAPGTPTPTDSPGEPGAPPGKSRRKTLAIVTAAAGGGAILVGAIFGAVAKSQSDKVESAAKNQERFDPSVESLGETSETVQWLGYGLGAAAVITGVILYVTAPGQSETPEPPRVALTPLAGPGTGGALLRVNF